MFFAEMNNDMKLFCEHPKPLGSESNPQQLNRQTDMRDFTHLNKQRAIQSPSSWNRKQVQAAANKCDVTHIQSRGLKHEKKALADSTWGLTALCQGMTFAWKVKLVEWQLKSRKKETFYFNCGNMPKRDSNILTKRHSGNLTRERSVWNQIGIKEMLRNFDEGGKLRRFLPQKFGRRIGVELQIEPATAKILVGFSPNLGT